MTLVFLLVLGAFETTISLWYGTATIVFLIPLLLNIAAMFFVGNKMQKREFPSSVFER